MKDINTFNSYNKLIENAMNPFDSYKKLIENAMNPFDSYNKLIENAMNPFDSYNELIENAMNPFDSYNELINSFNNQQDYIIDIDKQISFNTLNQSKKINLEKSDSTNKTIFEGVTEFKKAVIEKFKIDIMSEDLEFGIIGNTKLNIDKFLIVNKDYTVNAITQYALDNFDSSHIVYSVLHTLAHCDYDLIAPAGVTFALSASQHSDVEIQDFSIQCFDMWSNKNSLGYLKIMKIHSEWLNDYLQEVISNIESVNE